MRIQIIVLIAIIFLVQADIIPFNKQVLGEIYQHSK